MTNLSIIPQAKTNSNESILGRTLISLLDEACDLHSNNQALNQWRNSHWQSFSTLDFREMVSEIALGLGELALLTGDQAKPAAFSDRIAFVMHNDVHLCLMDMGSLLAGLVNVPIDLTQTIENIFFILRQTEAKTLVVSNLDLLYQLLPYLGESPSLKTLIIAEVPDNWEQLRSDMMLEGLGKCSLDTEKRSSKMPENCLHIPQFLCQSHINCSYLPPPFPQCVQLFSLDEIKAKGKKLWSSERVKQLRERIAPSDLATIIYIASETKRPKGVMLTHENISANVLSAFRSYPDLKTGAEEVALLFLPLTHIFARVFFYGHLNYGHSLYFSTPSHLIKHLKTVRPTIMITVPRFLEKVYERIIHKGQRLKGFERAVFNWGLKLAQRFNLNSPTKSLERLQMELANRLVFPKLRSVFGDRLKALICGGAGLGADLTNFFWAVGVPVFQGYGLTEASGVLCYNRGIYNRSGTVGATIPGVNLRRAEDGEILVKAPFMMQGYYRDTRRTQNTIDAEGWLHTGDLGEIATDGVLTITGVKKLLFKLSTGKYVSPMILEQEIRRSPLVKLAVVVGRSRKFCGMLIFPDLIALEDLVQKWGITLSELDWLNHPRIFALYQSLIDTANCHLPYWSNVRKFVLIDTNRLPSEEKGDYQGQFKRSQILENFATEIDSLYQQNSSKLKIKDPSNMVNTDLLSQSSCPIYARSLIHN